MQRWDDKLGAAEDILLICHASESLVLGKVQKLNQNYE